MSESLSSPPHGLYILRRRQFFVMKCILPRGVAGNFIFDKFQNRPSGPQIQSWLWEPSPQAIPPFPIILTFPVHSTLQGKVCERSEQLGDKSVLNSFCSLHCGTVCLRTASPLGYATRWWLAKAASRQESKSNSRQYEFPYRIRENCWYIIIILLACYPLPIWRECL